MEKGKPQANSQTALFIGRFQPFHKGHLLALKYIAERSSRVVVAIGSSQCGNEPKNPFTSREREKMIMAQVMKNGLAKKCEVVSVTDINNNEKWVLHVDLHVPEYGVVYSNNPLVRRLMKAAGKKVRRIPFFSRSRLDATKIRELISKSEEWEDRVPKLVLAEMKRLGAEKRIREMKSSQKKYA